MAFYNWNLGGVPLWLLDTYVIIVRTALQMIAFSQQWDFAICPGRSFQIYDIVCAVSGILWLWFLTYHHSHVDRHWGLFPICLIITMIPLWSSFPKLFKKGTSATVSLGEFQRNRTPGLKGMCTLHLIEHYQMVLWKSAVIYQPTHRVG